MFFLKINGLVKELSIVIIIKNLIIIKNSPNIRNKSSTFKYIDLIYFTDKSIIVRYIDNKDEIA